jgi:hypothetical protein
MKTRMFLTKMFAFALILVGLTGCTKEIVAPTPIYDQISILPLTQPTMNLKVGEERVNTIMLCLPRDVRLVTVEVSRSTSAVGWLMSGWGPNGATCEGARDLYYTYVGLFGQETGKAKVTLMFGFSRGNPMMTSFDVTVAAAPIMKG